jgi:hypothetical protein
MYGADFHPKLRAVYTLIVHTLPFEAEELLATLCQADMKVPANVVDVVPVLPLLVHKGGQHVQSLKLERTVLAPQVEEAIVVQLAGL